MSRFDARLRGHGKNARLRAASKEAKQYAHDSRVVYAGARYCTKTRKFNPCVRLRAHAEYLSIDFPDCEVLGGKLVF